MEDLLDTYWRKFVLFNLLPISWIWIRIQRDLDYTVGPGSEFRSALNYYKVCGFETLIKLTEFVTGHFINEISINYYLAVCNKCRFSWDSQRKFDISIEPALLWTGEAIFTKRFLCKAVHVILSFLPCSFSFFSLSTFSILVPKSLEWHDLKKKQKFHELLP